MKSPLLLLLLLILPVVVQAQFTFTTNNGAITITGYTGTYGAVVIPSATNGWPVTSIGADAFENNTDLASVVIPDSVTNVGSDAFFDCSNLTSIAIGSGLIGMGTFAFYGCEDVTNVSIGSGLTNVAPLDFLDLGGLTSISVNSNNPAYISLGGVLFSRDQTALVRYPRGKTGAYTIPNGVINIADNAFNSCLNLSSITIPNGVARIGNYAFDGCNITSITIPNTVTSIGNDAFLFCFSLASAVIGSDVASIGSEAFSGTALGPVYCYGNAPQADSAAFLEDSAVFYYLPGTTGWSTEFDGFPTVEWYLSFPLILNNSSGVKTNQFGFTVSWATNTTVVVDGSTNLSANVWQPIQTNSLNNGVFDFTDPQWKNYPFRFYRVSSQ